MTVSYLLQFHFSHWLNYKKKKSVSWVCGGASERERVTLNVSRTEEKLGYQLVSLAVNKNIKGCVKKQTCKNKAWVDKNAKYRYTII